MKLYYDVHVFYSRNNGYSIPLEIETNKYQLPDEEIIRICEERNLFENSGDGSQVDMISEIVRSEYMEMKSL